MAEKTVYHEMDAELIFHDSDGRRLSVQATELSADTLDGLLIRYFLAITVTPEVYQQIDKGEWFNLLINVRGQIFGGRLDPKTDVELDLKLDPMFVFDLSMKVKTIAEAAALLLQLNREEPDSDLLSGASWFALHVKQKVELPPEIGPGTLKVGYSTEWAKQ